MRLKRHRYLASAVIASCSARREGRFRQADHTRRSPPQRSPAGAGVINSSNPRASLGPLWCFRTCEGGPIRVGDRHRDRYDLFSERHQCDRPYPRRLHGVGDRRTRMSGR